MAAAAAKTGEVQKPKKKSGKLMSWLIILVFLFAVPFMLPTVLLLLAGLVPTYVALGTDNDPQKSGAVSVGMMNLAGLTPFVIDLWTKGQTVPNALHILTNTNSWLVILGASAVGHLIVYAIPQAIATLTLAQTESRLKIMRKNLEMLKESWGPEVGTTKPIDKIILD